MAQNIHTIISYQHVPSAQLKSDLRHRFIILVLATWVIRSGNKPFEKGIPFLYYLQTKEGEGKIGSRQYI